MTYAGLMFIVLLFLGFAVWAIVAGHIGFAIAGFIVAVLALLLGGDK